MSKIHPVPSEPPEFNPNEPRYWDARDLEVEMRRVFEICHNCRMCVGYCGTFPDVFARVDREIGLLKTDLGFVKSAVTDHSRDLREIRVELKETKAAVVRVEGALARKVDRDELEAIVQRARER